MKPLPKGLLITGVVLCLAPLLGLAFTFYGMVSALQSLGRAGISDPRILSERIGESLLSTAGGLIAAGVGMVLLIIAAILHFADRPKRVDPLLVANK